MSAINFDARISDYERRQRLFDGEIFVYSPNNHSMELVQLAQELIEAAFPDQDPQLAQFNYPVEEYASILTRLKPEFIHHPRAKEIMPKMFEALGSDLDDTYFDVPRMRSSTSNDYLTSGIAYAFHAHRDTWYSAPMSQINWWLPIYEMEAGNGMAFHPNYWSTSIHNNSEIYNYQEWNAKQRFDLKDKIKKDDRPQPKPQEDLTLEPNDVIVVEPGSMILFSAAQLHSSVPNQTGKTRFSIDFRVVNRSDLEEKAGAPNLDSKCTGSAIGDYLQSSTLTQLPESIQQMYMPGHPQPLVAKQS